MLAVLGFKQIAWSFGVRFGKSQKDGGKNVAHDFNQLKCLKKTKVEAKRCRRQNGSAARPRRRGARWRWFAWR